MVGGKSRKWLPLTSTVAGCTMPRQIWVGRAGPAFPCNSADWAEKNPDNRMLGFKI